VLPPSSSVVTDEEDFNEDCLVDPTEYAPENIVDVTGTLEIHEAPDPKKEASYAKISNIFEAAQIESLQATLGSKSCEVLNLLVAQTNLYAAQHNRHTFSINLPEMRSFLGFLIFT
jgi:hypothetical protein